MKETSDLNELEAEKNLARSILKVPSGEELYIIESGWTSRVYLARQGELVCKFPRYQEVKKEYEVEIEILRALASVELPVQVPEVLEVGNDFRYLAYHGVKGDVLKFQNIGKGDKKLIGQAIGQFIKALREQTLRMGHDLKLDKEISEHLEKYELGKSQWERVLSKEEFEILQRFMTCEYENRMRSLGFRAECSHGDLGFWNILFDKESGSIGVIDFGDYGIYDESIDFVGLRDPEMLNEALELFSGSEELRAKIHLRQSLLPVLEMPYYAGKSLESEIVQITGALRKGLLSELKTALEAKND